MAWISILKKYDMKGKGINDRHIGRCKFFFVINFVKLMHVSLRIPCTSKCDFQVNYCQMSYNKESFTCFDFVLIYFKVNLLENYLLTGFIFR